MLNRKTKIPTVQLLYPYPKWCHCVTTKLMPGYRNTRGQVQVLKNEHDYLLRTLADSNPSQLSTHLRRMITLQLVSSLTVLDLTKQYVVIQVYAVKLQNQKRSSWRLALATVILVPRYSSGHWILTMCNFGFICFAYNQCDQIRRFIAQWATFLSLWQQLFCSNL